MKPWWPRNGFGCVFFDDEAPLPKNPPNPPEETATATATTTTTTSTTTTTTTTTATATATATAAATAAATATAQTPVSPEGAPSDTPRVGVELEATEDGEASPTKGFFGGVANGFATLGKSATNMLQSAGEASPGKAFIGGIIERKRLADEISEIDKDTEEATVSALAVAKQACCIL